jgi:hypothetical protein
MLTDTIQTILVSKSAARGKRDASTLARPYASHLTHIDETSNSWRFRQRPESDFLKKSFRFVPLADEPGVILVFGKLKRLGNPINQKKLDFPGVDDVDTGLRDVDFWISISDIVKKAKTSEDLRKIIEVTESRGVKTGFVLDLINQAVADRARDLRILKVEKSIHGNQRAWEMLRGGWPNRVAVNPSTAKSRASNKRLKAPGELVKYVKLTSPKTMPDPGPCAWLGSLLELGWNMKRGESSTKVDDEGHAIWEPDSEWMFTWSPKYKAVVCVRLPKNMYKMAEVSSYGGAAKMFERFMARPAENTFEVNVPEVPLKELGSSSSHIVYRSDKWSMAKPKRRTEDYIHHFGVGLTPNGPRRNGVKIFCGPSLEEPEVFLCVGGKLTLTERGLVW